MIGTVAFDYRDGHHVATLMEDGSWTIDPPIPHWDGEVIVDYLAAVTDTYQGPSDGPFGPRQLATIATAFDGTFTLEPKASAPAGTIY